MVLESASPENATAGAGVVLQDLEGRPAGILFQPKARRDGPSPTASSSPAAAAVATRAQLGNGMGLRRGLTLESVMRAASPTGALPSAGASSVRKSAPSSPTTPLSAGVVVSARRVSSETVGGGTGAGAVGAGTAARVAATDAGASLGTEPPAAVTILQPAFVRTKSGGRASTGGRSRQNSANKLDVTSPVGIGTEEATRKDLPVPRRTSGASTGGMGADGTPKKPDGVPRRRGSGADGKSPGATGIAGKMAGKKGKGKDTGIAPPISVLIVEDNPINQTILSTFIKRKKIKCEVAQNGLQAVEKWKTGRFHLIFMDIQMPVMDGIEATREIRRLEKVQHLSSTPTPPIESPSPAESKQLSHPPTESSKLFVSGPSSPFRSSVVIVALTASNLQSDRVAALAAGCNDFLTKPVALDWLDKKIIEWGSIKALQMWADPEMVKLFQRGQDAKAKAVATQLRIERTPSRTRKLSVDDGVGKVPGVQINVQAPTPPVANTPVQQRPQKPPMARSMSKSPSPLSSSMTLPSEPPPPPAPTETEMPILAQDQARAEAEAGARALEVVDTALENHLEETKVEGGRDPLAVTEASNESAAKAPGPEAPESIDHVPELILDPPNGLTELKATAPVETNPIQATPPTPEPNPTVRPALDPAAIPASPSIRTDTPFLSANSVPPSPGDPSS
ncbi:ssk1 response regulator receiver [Ceratobasidium sp. 370]|nr:ssk1 response regulator receiver [Ceratobasidium sp. 370]